MIPVRQESEREFILGGKLLVRSLTVYGNAEYFDVPFLKVSERITKRTSLFGATRSIILRVKIEYYFLAAQIFKPNGLTVRVFCDEVGRDASFFGHSSLLRSLKIAFLQAIEIESAHLKPVSPTQQQSIRLSQ